jgi:hypothetical protein
MSTVYLDAQMTDAERRGRLYEGDLFVFSPISASREFCRFARGLAEEAFTPLQPAEAQFGLPVEKFAEILAALKPQFIHHPESKQYIRRIFSELGCDLDRTYFDVPRLRTMTHANYMAAGLAYPFHPHRDTWFSAPQCQLNWWIPVYDLRADNTIAFHPRYWDHPIRNSSRDYNYYKWNKESRRLAATQIRTETRKQPQAEEPFEKEPQIRLVCPAGGIIIFAGAYMHSTVPNTSGCTRFSIDFRSVNLDDVLHKAGAPNIDSECTGTTLRDFLRAGDLQRLPEEIASTYDQHPFVDGELVFDPASAVPAATRV